MTPELIFWLSVLLVNSQYSLVCGKDVCGSHLGEHVPDARTLAVLVPGALDLVEMQNDVLCGKKSYLIGSCGRAPEEVIRKGIIEQLFLRAVR